MTPEQANKLLDEYEERILKLLAENKKLIARIETLCVEMVELEEEIEIMRESNENN